MQNQAMQNTYGLGGFPASPIGTGLMGSAFPSPITPLETAFVAGPIIAHRIWNIIFTQDNRLCHLSSLNNSIAWPARFPFHAKCGAGSNPHCVPCHGCSCGVYALKGEEQLLLHPISAGNVLGPVRISGTVALWGKVIEHEHGYRAQYAYPYQLKFPRYRSPMPGFPDPPSLSNLDSIRENLEKQYGITTISY